VTVASSRCFTVTMPVDYADTDAGGVVYYANYLAHMERARNAWLRSLGWPVTVLARRHCVLFTVTQANLRYHAPAHLDDELAVTLDVQRLQRASIRFRQTVLRVGDGEGDGHRDGDGDGDGEGDRDGDGDNALLVAAEIRLGAVNGATFKPCRLPAPLTVAIDRWRQFDRDLDATVTVAPAFVTPAVF